MYLCNWWLNWGISQFVMTIRGRLIRLFCWPDTFLPFPYIIWNSRIRKGSIVYIEWLLYYVPLFRYMQSCLLCTAAGIRVYIERIEMHGVFTIQSSHRALQDRVRGSQESRHQRHRKRSALVRHSPRISSVAWGRSSTPISTWLRSAACDLPVNYSSMMRRLRYGFRYDRPAIVCSRYEKSLTSLGCRQDSLYNLAPTSSVFKLLLQ